MTNCDELYDFLDVCFGIGLQPEIYGDAACNTECFVTYRKVQYVVHICGFDVKCFIIDSETRKEVSIDEIMNTLENTVDKYSTTSYN